MNPPARPVLFGLLIASLWSLAAAGKDRPAALVEDIDNAPNAGVERFAYVYDGDKVDLRDAGVLTLAFFDTCEVVIVSGGVVKVTQSGAEVSKGGEAQSETRPCQTAALALDEDASEAGAAVKRVSPFMGEDWREITVATAHPVFIWPAGAGADYSVAVFYLDAAPVRQVWQAPFVNGIAYPDDAPPLEAGMPYEVVITRNGKAAASAVFSFDPALELPDGPLNSAIPLGL